MSTDSYYLAGRAANGVLHAQGVTVSSEDTNPDFQKASLQNGRPWHPFRFGSVAADPHMRFDMNMVVNGDFELDAAGTSPPSGWRTVSGSPTVVTNAPAGFDGLNALELSEVSEGCFQDLLITPGSTYRVDISLRGDGTRGAALYVRDLRTGKWYDGAGNAWVTTKTVLKEQTAATWADFLEPVPFESALSEHHGPSRARILLERTGSGAGTTYADSCFFYPKITFASLHYHTIPTGLPIQIWSDTDPAFGSPDVVATLPQRPFRSWVTFAGLGQIQRYWAFQIIGIPPNIYIPWVGQPVLGEHRTLDHALYEGSTFARTMPQGGIKTERIHLPANEAEASAYRFELSYLAKTADLAQAVDQLLGESGHGQEPVVFVPHADRHEVIYGRASAQHSFSRLSPGLSRHTLSIQDDPYPVVTT